MNILKKRGILGNDQRRHDKASSAQQQQQQVPRGGGNDHYNNKEPLLLMEGYNKVNHTKQENILNMTILQLFHLLV
ncbi:unnamed protein product [Cunninghamella blakesleeana]